MVSWNAPILRINTQSTPICRLVPLCGLVRGGFVDKPAFHRPSCRQFADISKTCSRHFFDIRLVTVTGFALGGPLYTRSRRVVAAGGATRRLTANSLRKGRSRLGFGRKSVLPAEEHRRGNRCCKSRAALADLELANIDFSRAGCAHFLPNPCLGRPFPSDFHVTARPRISKRRRMTIPHLRR